MTIIALAFLFAAAAAGEATEPQSPTSLARQLYLRVSTHSGRQPLELGIMGELRGIDPAMLESCTIRVEFRTYVTLLEMKLEERTDYPCIADTMPGNPLSTFKKKLILSEPGNYLLRIMLLPKEGRPIAGMTQEVRVYRASWESKPVMVKPQDRFGTDLRTP